MTTEEARKTLNEEIVFGFSSEFYDSLEIDPNKPTDRIVEAYKNVMNGKAVQMTFDDTPTHYVEYKQMMKLQDVGIRVSLDVCCIDVYIITLDVHEVKL